jgi:alkylation response protein AidB-like acyl-CoA dehydrogenase
LANNPLHADTLANMEARVVLMCQMSWNWMRLCMIFFTSSFFHSIWCTRVVGICLFCFGLLQVTVRGNLLFALDVAATLGRVESAEELYNSNSTSPPSSAHTHDEGLLRLLTPILKMFTAKEAVTLVSEGVESFGGAGYVEDTKV